MNFRKASLKLTFSYLLIVMLISVTFSIILYQISSLEIDAGLTRQGRILEQIPDDTVPRPFRNFENIRKEQLDQSNQHLKMNLIYFNLVILVLSGMTSWWLARRTLKPIEEIVDLQNRFTADASHELRTPLTAMRTEIEVLMRDKKVKISDFKNLLKSNLEEIEKLRSLSDSLLKLANYQGKKKNITFDKVSLKDLIQEAYQKILPIAKSKQIQFKFDLKEALVKGNASELVELFIILFDNAVKYSPTNSKVWVNLKKIDHYLEIKVKDEGYGIKATDLPYIFNRFYRADLSRSREQISGYGLGLAIAKQIVESHKGEILVESKLDQGSTFVVKLPLTKF